MRSVLVVLLTLALPAMAQDESNDSAAAEQTEANQPTDGVKTMSGMSILGNEEAPKSLVIVPWKSSRLGDGLGVAHSLDETPRAVDRDVFMRELHYYELRSGPSE